jgi:uncharacterized membrane protein YqjE
MEHRRGAVWNLIFSRHSTKPLSAARRVLIVAVVVVAILLIAFPAYRWFFLISLGIGLVVAAILFLWHKYRPIREEDVHNKRPLGLG